MKFLITKPRLACFFVFSIVTACGMPELPSSPRKSINGEENTSDQRGNDRSAARINLTATRSDATSLQSIADIEYINSDYVSVIRCSSEFSLRGPTGKVVRDSTGKMNVSRDFELRAVWEQALESTSSCRLLGEKLVRSSFADPLAATGNYFYLFNPCRETLGSKAQVAKTLCSFQLTSSEDVALTNTLTEKTSSIAILINKKEAELAALALIFRQQMSEALNAQKSCENNEAIDAVKESRWKALSGVLMTGIAASIGGAVAGPQAAVAAAQKTLQWIMENFNAGTSHNPSHCKLLQDVESKAQQVASEIDSITKQISQLQGELAQSQQ